MIVHSFLACEKNNLDILKYLMDINNDLISISNGLFESAIRRNNIDMTEYLLTKCADRLIINDDLLMTAVKYNNFPLVKHIVSSGYQINSKLYKEVLIISFENKCDTDEESMSLYLLSLNIEINNTDKVQLFNKASYFNNYQSAKFFFEENKLELYLYPNGYVCYHKDHVLAEKLSRIGKQITLSDLLNAINDNNLETIKFCIEIGIDITKNNNKAMRRAYKKMFYPIVQYLYGIYMERGIMEKGIMEKGIYVERGIMEKIEKSN